MKELTLTAKNEQQAIEMAAKQLDIEQSSAKFSVTAKASKGIFGMGGTEYLVQVFEEGESIGLTNDECKTLCAEFVETILKKMNEICEVEVAYNEQENSFSANIIGGDAGRIIGRKGETLDALRYLTKIVINRAQNNVNNLRVELDIEGYNQKHKEAIMFKVKEACRKVVKYSRNVELEPMTAYDRRIAHCAAQEIYGIKSISVGNFSNRRVMLTLDKE